MTNGFHFDGPTTADSWFGRKIGDCQRLRVLNVLFLSAVHILKSNIAFRRIDRRNKYII